jgi:hypothetical protein
MEDVTAKEGTFFPQMRTEVDSITRKIYSDKIDFPPKDSKKKEEEKK